MDLFASAPTQLAADAEGGIRYWPGFAETADAAEWFDVLRAGIDWHSERRKMYDRIVEVPRLLAAHPVAGFPDALPLADILARVRIVAPAPYNSADLNFYRDGRDSVAMHNDKLHTVVPGAPIALVSLGSPRRMAIRAKTGERRSIGLELAPGSLLVMSHASQLSHEHGIPKTVRPVGPRISVVFRVRPERWTTDY